MSTSRKPREPGPLEQLESLERDLAAGKPLLRGYLVRGDEPYFREAALRALAEAAARAGLELARHDAGDPDFKAAELCDDLGSASMFAPARCVVVRRANRLLRQEPGEEPQGGATVEALLAFLRRKTEAGVLVLEGQGLRIDSAPAKAIKEAGGSAVSLRKLYETPPHWAPDPRKVELVQWLLARARARGLDLRPDDAVFVAAATGNELAALEEKLERIQNRGGENLRSVVPWTAGGSPFQIAEELVAGNLQRALPGLEALFRGGFQGKDGRETNEGALIAMLLGSLRNKLRASLAAVEADSARTPEGWERFAREVWALERRSRLQGVDVDELFRFALRTRVRRQRSVR